MDPGGRRLILLGTPAAGLVLSLLHPRPHAPVAAYVGAHLGRWLIVHVAQLGLVALLGVTLWLLVDDLRTAAARVTRVSVVVFLVFYTAFDAIVGIATGVLAALARSAPEGERAAALGLVERFWEARLDPSLPVGPLILVGDLAWVASAGAAAVALYQTGASRLAVVLLAIAGVALGIDHPFPTGTIGMAALLAAVVLLERET